MSWPVVQIGDVSEIVTGKTPSTADEANFGGDIPFVTPAELDCAGVITVTPRTLTDIGATNIRLVPQNSILVGCIGTLGKVGMAGRQLATNQQINAIVFDELKIWPRFGFYAAQRLRPEMERVAPATTLKIISKSKFSAFTIPLPPLEEQKRIAWILDQADAVRRLRTRALDKLNTLGQAIFHEMFGRFQFGTGDWPTVELGELVKDAKIGLVRGVTEQGDELPVRYLRMDSISVDGALSFEGLRSVEANQNEIGSYGLIIGDFLLNTRNSRELVGKTAVVREAFDGVYNNNILRLRFDNRMCGAFLDSYLRTPSGKNALENQKSGTTSVFAIYQKSLMKMPIPLPPVELQRLFTERLSILFREKGRSVRSAQQFKYLFASLQHRAFRGDL